MYKSFILLAIIPYATLYNICDINRTLCINQFDEDVCKIKSYMMHYKECSAISFAETEKPKNDYRAISLKVYKSSSLQLNISFSNIWWRKVYLQLSDKENLNHSTCKSYSIGHNVELPLSYSIYDDCFWNNSLYKTKSLLLEFKAENKLNIVTKRIVFQMPSFNNFGEDVISSNVTCFTYVVESNSLLVLYVQTLPKKFNVSYYKVEVYKQTDDTFNMVDVRMFSAQERDEIEFEYVTYNEEGNYYFATSFISDECLEDLCLKSYTPIIHVHRKGTPLVIGIVGASFIIPFVLFLFHMWNRKYKREGIRDTDSKVVFIYKPSSDLHVNTVTALAKIVQDVTGKQVVLEAFQEIKKVLPQNQEEICSDVLILASHIVYIPPPAYDTPNCEIDYMTYIFLKEELKKNIPEKQIIICRFPHSSSEIPSILRDCTIYNLMDDFKKFLECFQLSSKKSEQIDFSSFVDKLEAARVETELKNSLNVPKIIVTEQSDGSDVDAKEVDELL